MAEISQRNFAKYYELIHSSQKNPRVPLYTVVPSYVHTPMPPKANYDLLYDNKVLINPLF